MKKIFVFVIVVFFVSIIFARDDQVWFTSEISVNFFENCVFNANERLKFDNDKLFVSQTMLKADYKFNQYFGIGVGHQFIRERSKKTNHYDTEQRSLIDFYLNMPEFATLKLDSRTRIEWRDRPNAEPYLRYRERLRLRTSYGLTSFHISPFISGEFFFSDQPHIDSSNLFDRMRSEIGFSFYPVPELKSLSATLSLLIQHDIKNKASSWQPTNIWCFSLAYKF